MSRARCLLLSLVVALASASPAAAKVVVVSMRDNVATSSFFFDPAYIVVSRGDTVEWRNAGTVSHTSTSAEGLWASPLLAPGGVFRRQMNEAGPHQYFCIPHEPFNMVGAVSVITHRVVSVAMNDNFMTQSFFFKPSSVTASPGDTIKWTNAGSTVHTATSGTEGTPGEGVLFGSAFMNPGDMFQWVVTDTSGVVPYFCQPHGVLGMTGSITIQPSGIDLPGTVADANLGLRMRSFGAGGSSTLDFRLVTEDRVIVSVVDARGATIARLVDGTLPAGAHEVRWSGERRNGGRAASGVYFYHVRIGARHGSTATVLVR